MSTFTFFATAGLAIAIELLTIMARSFFGPFKDRYRKIKFKYKVRIHHGYVGIILCVISYFYTNEAVFIVGGALFISDALHHFLVLPIWVGRTEFP